MSDGYQELCSFLRMCLSSGKGIALHIDSPYASRFELTVCWFIGGEGVRIHPLQNKLPARSFAFPYTSPGFFQDFLLGMGKVEKLRQSLFLFFSFHLI